MDGKGESEILFSIVMWTRAALDPKGNKKPGHGIGRID